MRNLKKIVAVIMTVALLASMMVPALAAVQNEDKAEALKAIGLFLGDGTSFYLDQKLSREQGMTVVVRAMGAEAAAKAMSAAEIEAQLANVVDADKIADWAKPYAAYCLANGITKGIGGVAAGKVQYGAQLDLHGDEFVILLLRAMGYTVDKDNCWDVAVEAKVLTAGQAVALKYNGSIVRDDVVGVLYAAVKDGVCADGKTLIATLIANGAVDEAEAAAVGFVVPKPVAKDLAIEDVVALNTLQLQVVFNKPVNEDDAKNTAKYQVKDKDDKTKNISNAAIEADGKTVTLTLAPDSALSNNSVAKLTVYKEFRDAAGTKTTADIVYKDIAVNDTAFPQFERVEAVGLKTLRLYFSEPVVVSPDAFSIKSGNQSWAVQANPKVDNVNKYVELRLGTNLVEGNIEVKVKSNKVFDYAGLMVFEKTINYSFAKVVGSPSATIDEATSTKVVIKFDRPVYGKLKLSHGVKDYSAYTVTVSKYQYEAAATDTWEFNFSNKIPAGNVTLFLFGDGDVKDLYGNKFEGAQLTLNLVADVTAPVVSEAKVIDDGKKLQVTFDEDIDSKEVKVANYALKKADGTNVPIKVEMDGSKKVIVTPLTGKFEDMTNYELTIKKVKDLEGNTATDLIVTFTTEDNTNPSVKVDDSYYIADEGKIFIVFSEAMKDETVLDKSNYMVITKGATGTKYEALGDNDTVYKYDDKTIVIDLESKVDAPKVLLSANITDLAGKKLFTDKLSDFVHITKTESLNIKSAELIAKNTIKVKFDKEISQFDPEDIKVVSGSTNITVNGVTSIGSKEVEIELGVDLSTDAKYENAGVNVVAESSPKGTKTTNGSLLTGNTVVALEDKLAPEVSKDKDEVYEVTAYIALSTASNGLANEGDTGYIEIKFSEQIDNDSLSKLSFTVGGYTVTSVSSSNTNIVRIEVKCDEDNTTNKPIVTQKYDISDLKGNVLKAENSWSTK